MSYIKVDLKSSTTKFDVGDRVNFKDITSNSGTIVEVNEHMDKYHFKVRYRVKWDNGTRFAYDEDILHLIDKPKNEEIKMTMTNTNEQIKKLITPEAVKLARKELEEERLEAGKTHAKVLLREIEEISDKILEMGGRAVDIANTLGLGIGLKTPTKIKKKKKKTVTKKKAGRK